MPVEPGPFTLTPIGAPPVPPDTEALVGSGRVGRGAGSVGIVTVSADAGAASVHRATPVITATSVASLRPCPIEITSRV